LTKEQTKLPVSLRLVLKRGLDREEAAAYIGISAGKFDQLIADGRMPSPKRIDSRRVWDVHQLDSAFDNLPGGDDIDDEWAHPEL
jgi:hypothetical protein